MAQPTQELPPWLTASITTLTDAAGVPVSTSTTLLFLPLTYYGPSIPLGPDWTYGGLTSPASTSSIPSTSAIPSSSDFTSAPDTTAIPSPIPSESSSSSLPSESSTIASITETPTSSSFSSSFPSDTTSISPSPTAAAATGGHRSLIGIILGSVFGGILLLFVFGLYICLRRRKHRQPRFSIVNPSSEEFYMVREPDWRLEREPGVGSPRISGDEQDPFLVEPGTTGLAAVGGRPRTRPGGAVAAPLPTATRNSNGSGTSASNSGYGTLLDASAVTATAAGSYAAGFIHDDNDNSYSARRGPILSRNDLSRLDEESTHSQTHPSGVDIAPLLPPPRLDPDQFGVRSVSPLGTPARPQGSQGSLATKRSSYPIDAEEAANAKVLTARRVKMEDLGPRSLASPTSPDAPLLGGPLLGSNGSKRRSSGAWLSGLGNLANSLGRLSWFKGPESPQASTSHAVRSSQYSTKGLTDEELEAGRVALLDEKVKSPEDEDQADDYQFPSVRAVPASQGDRPISSVSARSAASGNSVYHDAHSSLRGANPSPAPSHLRPSPVPRAMTPHSQRHSGYYATRDSGYVPPDHPMPIPVDPPSYDDSNSAMNQSPRSSYPGATALVLNPHGGVVDILDFPVPAPVLPPRHTVTLASSSLTDLSSSSLRDTANGSTRTAIKGGLAPIMPPGLWQDTSTMASTARGTEGTSMNTSSYGSLAAQRSPMSQEPSMGILRESDFDEPISIEVLEELPPVSGERWRSLAQAGGLGVQVSGDRRQTFGGPALIVHPRDPTTSEQASLHSMRSHLAPGSGRSAGSSPASPPPSARGRRWAGDGSLGSNSSRPSAHSAAATGSGASAVSISLSHQGSFTRHPSGIVASPALSAFGHNGPRISEIPSIPSTHFSSGHGHGHRLTGTGSSSGAEAPLPPLPTMPAQAARGDSGLLRVASPEVAAGGERATSPQLSHMSAMPWAGGLDHDWAPA
ncbi:hypothetical protein HGRIS_000986 [Hohenbuehelia grisea]|uniref:Uncharacterized protein n=1 Tax=Hohenbuehelia grisea TaxID=104357 RepID=A0ABR3IQE0_9AGAR